MTLRRFMWIFVGIALFCFALAGAGRWWLQWPAGPVRTWMGVGAGYVAGALLLVIGTVCVIAALALQRGD